jgi:hypothetical protein
MPHKLAIFGTSGRTGRELAKVAGSKDWEVCGFVRPTSMVEGGIVNGWIVRGNFNELDRVIETIADSKAVCCMIGPRPPIQMLSARRRQPGPLSSVGLSNRRDDRTCAHPIASRGMNGSGICKMAASVRARSRREGMPR